MRYIVYINLGDDGDCSETFITRMPHSSHCCRYGLTNELYQTGSRKVEAAKAVHEALIEQPLGINKSSLMATTKDNLGGLVDSNVNSSYFQIVVGGEVSRSRGGDLISAMMKRTASCCQEKFY